MMDSQARHELSRAIQREGVVLFENPQRIKALLMDACPESRMEIGLLIQAAEDDIPARLARSSESVFRDSEIARAVADLKKTRRLDDGAAQWVVRSWAWALGVLDTEPSDDVGDATSVTPTPGSLSAEQAESPPYPSTPPSGPGDATSFPPAGSSSGSGPGPYTEPWPGVTSGGESASQGSGGPPWVSQPTVQGSAAGSLGGPPPPANTGWGAASPPPPPGRGRRRLFAILGAVAAVIALAVVVMALIPNSGPSPAPPVPPDPKPGQINFTITDSLDSSLEVAETTTVYSFAREVGTLELSTSQPNASLPVVTDSTNVDYQLEVTLIATTDGKQHTFNGTGTIAVYEGAVYRVALTQDSAGNFVGATLEPKQHGS
jgi:hypothetical protein